MYIDKMILFDLDINYRGKRKITLTLTNNPAGPVKPLLPILPGFPLTKTKRPNKKTK